MLPLAHIPVQPSSQDCLAWSLDGELAVAAGEEVYLLIPRNGSPEPWTHARITVSRFTTEEWPWQEQASFEDMSIGEEQARATVTALAWSPPGLAKHRRSVLAVLTSNLILALWASDSDPADPDSWKRVLIINKALFSGSRLRQRIRSMAWAPTNPQHVDRRTPFSRRRWGIPLIAIADDSNGLYILKISSPFAGQPFAWNVEVLYHDDIPVPNRTNDRPSLLNRAMNANHFIDRIAFGTWDGDISLVYRTSGITHHASLSVHEDPPSRVQLQDVSDNGDLVVSLSKACHGDSNMYSQIPVTPLIKSRMTTEKEAFGLVQKIGSHVVLRTWGLASFNNLVAASITLHPAKTIEYTAPFEGNATILFDDGNEYSNAESLFQWQRPVEVDAAKAQRSILDIIFDKNQQKSLDLNSLDLRIIYTAFCGALLLSDDKRLQRLQAALDMLNLIERHASVDLSVERRALQSIKNSHQLSDEQLSEIIGQMTKTRSLVESSSCNAEKSLLDSCPFCAEIQKAIPFDNFTEAYCPQRHSFGRLCSFLPDTSFTYKSYRKVRTHLSAAT